MSQNILNDISKVYLEQIATEAAKPDYLDFDKDGNKKESMKKALKDKKEVAEAVRGQDTEMRKAASAERRAGDTLTKKLPPSKGKQFGQYQSDQIAYIDKKTKGKHIPGMTRESLDPVGHEDADIDNDGDTDKSDKYLHKRRKAIGKAIATRKESFSDWRQDLSEVMEKIEKDDEHKQIKEKKNINNKVVINPDFKEAVEELGGVLLESVEVDEAYQPIDKDKENRMYRRAGNLARTAVSSTGKKKEVAQKKSSKIVSAITRQKEKERFDRIGQSPTHNEAFVDPEHGESPSGRSPLQNVSDHPKASVRKTAVKGFKKQMSKEYGGKWKSRSGDPVGEEVSYVNEDGASKKAETQFHDKLDKMVHKTFGKRKEEKKMKEEVEKIDENRAAMRDPENYEREQRRSQSSRERRMNDPKTGINSKAFNDFYNAQMASKKKKANEEFELDEKILTPAETKKKEEIVMSMKKKGDFSKYGERAKEVMYATATKQAKKLAEADMPQETQDTDNRARTQQKQKLLQILQQKERAVRAGMTDISASYEAEGEVIDEAKQSFPFKKVKKQMEKARAGSVYAKKGNPAVPNTTDSEKRETTRFSKMHHASEKAKREKQDTDKARRSSTFYKDTHPASATKMKKANEEFEILDERRREEKGTPRKPRDKAFELISKSMGAGRMGVQPRGKKKVPGEKKPSTQITPAEKVKRRRDSAQRAQDAMHSPRD